MPTIAATSDLHGYLPEIPPCDILLIAGDLCGPSDISKQRYWLAHAFRDWLDSIPAKEVVVIAGNHDWIFEKTPLSVPKLRWHYLQDSGVELFGLKIWGSPWQPRFFDWAFNLDEIDLDRKFALIPEGTDILVTHGPPLGRGDYTDDGQHAGSPSLMWHTDRVAPKLHVFGHIHEGYGCCRGTRIAANVSYVNAKYEPVNPVMTWEIV